MGRIFGSLSAIFFAMMYNLIAFFIYFVFLVGVFFVPSIHNSFDFFVTQNFSLAVLSLLAAVIIIIIAIRRFFLTAGNIKMHTQAVGLPVWLCMEELLFLILAWAM